MKTLTMMVGLPRSGKSTRAMEFGCPIVCPDAIRLAIHGQAYVPETERMIWTIAHYMVKALFLAGHDHVVLDATSVKRRDRNKWKSPMWKREYVIIRTPKSICIERAKETKQEYLIPVIEKMEKEYEPVRPEEYS